MDRRTLIAIVLSIAVVFGFSFLQPVLFPPKPVAQTETPASVPAPAPSAAPTAGQTALVAGSPAETAAVAGIPEQNYPVEDVVVDTGAAVVTISSAGGAVTSYKLKHHKEVDGSPVEMINTEAAKGRAFELSFSGYDKFKPLSEPFAVNKLDAYTVAFSRVYQGTNGKPFTLTKTYRFAANEYLFEIKVQLDGADNSIPVTNAEPVSYSIGFGPQMGPHFTALDGSNEFRKYMRLSTDNREEIWLNNERKDYSGFVKWAAITGKYFTLVVAPDTTNGMITWSNVKGPQHEEYSRLNIARPVASANKISESYKFYLGPKEEKELLRYDDPAKNAFQMPPMKMTQVLENNPFLGWLEFLLKEVLKFFYYGIGGIGTYNWGIAIILLTILVKAVTWPLTAKSYRSMAAMQVIQPKLQEIQSKYKNDPQKLNVAMAELYKKEGVNPLSGCLPLLLQMPILFALFGMFSNHFDLRGAMFIPGWIPDLSIPDSIWAWDKAISIPFIGNHLRLLPILMVVTQIWTSLISMPPGPMTTQNKIMVFLLPGMMFFFFYAMPSGLQIYWVLSNVLQAIQQMLSKNAKPVPAKKGPVLLKSGKNKISK